TFKDVIELFEKDPQTTHLVVIGEIGGSDEERAAELLAKGSRLKTVAFISGRTAPEGKRMGHAGAIISGNRGTAKSKEEAFAAAARAPSPTCGRATSLMPSCPIPSVRLCSRARHSGWVDSVPASSPSAPGRPG